MSAAMDSWEKIEEDMENDPDCAYFDRIRALRELDEKQWEIVGQCIEYAEVAENTFRAWERSRREYEASENMHYLVNRLREAREGRDA